jgi:hypothetical protein
MEQWKQIKDFEDYEISNLGRIKRKEKFLTPVWAERYYVVCLCDVRGHKNKYVHRLLAEAFIPNPENKPQVDHINRDRRDNSLSNLRWVTESENGRNQRLKGTNTGEHHITQMKNGSYHVSYSIERLTFQKNFKKLEDAIVWRDENLP